MPDFKDYEKLLWKLAHRHSAKTGRDVEELFAVASVGFVDATRAWEKQRRNNLRFSSFLTQMVWFEFDNDGARYRRRVRVAREHTAEYSAFVADTQTVEMPEDAAMFRQGLERLSKDGQEVVRIVFDCPHQIQRLTKTSLSRWFKEFGWTQKRCDLAFSEITGMLA